MRLTGMRTASREACLSCSNRDHRVRAAETGEKALRRKQQNRDNTASVRAGTDVSVQQAIVSFQCDIKSGPDFVRTCCHRLMYGKSVVPCNLAQYTKCSNGLLRCVFSADIQCVCETGKEWVCKSCDRALRQGVVPLQAKLRQGFCTSVHSF